MITKYENKTAYDAAGAPTTDSRIAQITGTNEVRVDGVNVIVDIPSDGDAVFYDADGNDVFVKSDTIVKDLLPNTWTHVGYAFGCDGKTVHVLDKKDDTTAQWLGAWQFAITSISATTIKFWLKMKGDYATFVPIEVSLTSAEINATTVAEINAALEAAGNMGNVGYANHGYWAYLANANYEKVDSDGTCIVVQCDFNGDYRQYQCSDGSHALVGCTMSLSVWRDMPANSALWQKRGVSHYLGGLNYAKFLAYYSASGATPTANVTTGSTSIVNRTSFNESQYCADLRAYYGTYEVYIDAQMVRRPHPHRGIFALMDAVQMTAKYGNMTVTKKDGETQVYLFPALHYGLTCGYGDGKYAVGKWHLADITDGAIFMSDYTLARIAEAQRRMGTTVLTNSVARWFARRYGANSAWFFYGTNGTLTTNGVTSSYRCSGVTLFDLE